MNECPIKCLPLRVLYFVEKKKKSVSDFDPLIYQICRKQACKNTWCTINTWRSWDLRSAECASFTTRILHHSPLQSVTGVWTWEKKQEPLNRKERWMNVCNFLTDIMNTQTPFFFSQLLLNRQQRFNPETRNRAFLRLLLTKLPVSLN